MAAIDKTYVTLEQLQEAISWAKEVGTVELENGYKFQPLNWIYNYNDLDDPDFWNIKRDYYILWNTPQWFDRWLWINCPLEFIRDRLKEQYNEESLGEFENWEYKEQPKRECKYTFLEVPRGKYPKWTMGYARKNNPWPGNCKQATYMCEIRVPGEEFEREYNEQVDQWYEIFGMLPCGDSFIWQKYHKRIPSKKAIIRQLNKWNLPKGTKVKLWTRYVGLDFKILVK